MNLFDEYHLKYHPNIFSMNYLVIIFIFMLTILYCSSQSNNNVNQLNLCDTLIIVSKMIDLPDLEQFYHADVFPNRKPLIIMKNDVFGKDFEFFKFREKVLFQTENELKPILEIPYITPYLEFITFEIKNDTANVLIEYKVEGARVSAKFVKQDSEWKILKTWWSEY